MARMGVYSIKNLETGREYVGSSSNIAARLSRHRVLLKNAKHHCDEMIEDWGRYGEEGFEFRILEILKDKEKLLSREEYWIKEVLCRGGACYNKRIDVRRTRRTFVGIGTEYLSEMRALIGKNPQAAMLLMFLVEHMDKENKIFCTHGYMQKYFDCSRASISRYIKCLVSDGFVSIIKRGNFNVYIVNVDIFSMVELTKSSERGNEEKIFDLYGPVPPSASSDLLPKTVDDGEF